MEIFAQVERFFWLCLSITLSLILIAHLYVHLSVKWSSKKYRCYRKAKPFKVAIVQGKKDQWCSLYVGKTIVVKPFFNDACEQLDFLYTVVPCRENKRVLNEPEYLRTKYASTLGITLSVWKENVEVLN